MPKLPRIIVDSTFYLYSSYEAAKKGRPFGGTGVWIGMPTGIENTWFLYALTCYHVAVSGGHSVIRCNKRDGTPEIFDLDPSEWEFPLESDGRPGADIAIAKPKGLDMNLHYSNHQTFAITTDIFLKQQDIAPRDARLFTPRTQDNSWPLDIGPGEDIFMVGRFVDYDGKDTNVPSVRFGNISVMPQIIKQENGCDTRESFTLDLHSRSGYSCSPVFIYRTPGSDLTAANIIAGQSNHFIKFLGLHWGQFPELWPLLDEEQNLTSGAGAATVAMTGDRRHVKGMSGMTCAVPAWDVLEFLQMPVFKDERDTEIERLRRDPEIMSRPVGESVLPDASAQNQNHREDFTSLLNAAAKTKPQADQT